MELVFAANRKHCPECAYAISVATYKAKYDLYRENARAKEKAKEKPPKPPKKKLSKLDTYIKEQSKQCKNCKYHYKDGDYEFCDYVSWHGQLRDKGEGAGQCRSFLPKETKIKKKKTAYVWR